jgi:uridine phosphorylase
MNSNHIISSTDLIINSNGTAYHLAIHPDQLPNRIFMVGDPERVPMVSQYFDKITDKIHKREFVSHFGEKNGERIGVISSGIGPDNVEIVMTELDALANINFKTREIKSHKRKLQLIRIGTSGSIQEDIPVDSFLVSKAAIGIDNLSDFYDFDENLKDFNSDDIEVFKQNFPKNTSFYLSKSSDELVKKYKNLNFIEGLTVSTPGFYAPQGREIRLKNNKKNYLEQIRNCRLGQLKPTNLEMETASYYAFGKLMGHEMISFNAILANRITNEFSKNPEFQIERLIELVMNYEL